MSAPGRYNLAADAGETANLAGRVAERDRTLSRVMRSTPRCQAADAPKIRKRGALRSLGYVNGLRPRALHQPTTRKLIAIVRARGVDLFTHAATTGAISLPGSFASTLTWRSPSVISPLSVGNRTAARAIEVLQRAVAAGAPHGGVTTQLGNYLAEAGNPGAAIPLLEPLTSGEAVDADALNALGIAYARAGRRAQAQQTFERMLTVDPSSGMALANLGALALERSDVATARAFFERATLVDPTSSQAHARLVSRFPQAGQPDAAVTAWKRAVELDSTNFDALYNLGTTLAGNGHLDEARPFLERFAQTAPRAFYEKDISNPSHPGSKVAAYPGNRLR